VKVKRARIARAPGGRDPALLIGELSERTGVSRRALRYYEDQGLLVPERARNGYREYADDAPRIVDQIQGLYSAGLDSEAIRHYLPCAEGPEPRLTICPELRAHLLDRATALDAQAAAIERQRAKLAAHLGPGEPLCAGAVPPITLAPLTPHPMGR
jgi:DNA-binding transcriptional MerR regulator